MISVVVFINNVPILARSAVNVTPGGINNEEPNLYSVDDGTTIKHMRNEGAAKLAIKMLKTIKETVR